MRPTKRATFACALLPMLSIISTAWATEIAVCTDKGPFTIELFDAQAPLHTANFLRYIEQGFYSGTVFHRVVNGIIVQGGGHDRELKHRTTFAPVQNESRNGLSNERGTLAAARTADPALRRISASPTPPICTGAASRALWLDAATARNCVAAGTQRTSPERSGISNSTMGGEVDIGQMN